MSSRCHFMTQTTLDKISLFYYIAAPLLIENVWEGNLYKKFLKFFGFIPLSLNNPIR